MIRYKNEYLLVIVAHVSEARTVHKLTLLLCRDSLYFLELDQHLLEILGQLLVFKFFLL